MGKPKHQSPPTPRAGTPDQVALRGDPVGHLVRVRCTYCHDGLKRDRAVFCASCLAPHHAVCHTGHGRCAGPGCGELRAVRPSEERSPRARRVLIGLRAGVLLAAVGAAVAVLRMPTAATPEPVPPAGSLLEVDLYPMDPDDFHPPEFPHTGMQPIVEREQPRQQPPLIRMKNEELRLVTRGFRYRVQLEKDESIIIDQDGGFVRARLLPGGRRPTWHRARTIMVAEPGDSIELRNREAEYTLRPLAGQPLVIETKDREVWVGPLPRD